MTDSRKLSIAVILSLSLILSTIFYNLFQDYLKSHLISYIKRRIYYEQVISKKDLSRHRARYWKKVE